MLSKANKTKVRAIIRKQLGHCNLSEIRKMLKAAAIDEGYGAETANIKLGGGVELMYTSNPNHFCKFGVKLQLVGMVNTLALTAKDLTKAGKIRGCHTHFAL